MQKISFAVSNPSKCIANLRTQPMHFKMNLEIYQISFVMKEVLYIKVNLFVRIINNFESFNKT